jgi:hypothetical protein
MKLVDRLVGRFLGDDMVESAWWTDAVYWALEQDRLREQGGGTAVDVMATAESSHGIADCQ